MHSIKLIKWATATVMLLASTFDTLAAPEDLADFYHEREEQFLNVKITVRIEEGFSTIPQDSKCPIDSSKTFFTCHTVDRETHKSGGIIYACFPNDEATQAQANYEKFSERSLPLSGVLRKTPQSGKLYLDCRLADQKTGSKHDPIGGTVESASKDYPSSAMPSEVKNKAIASTVVIRTESGGGSGFAVEDGGKKYIVTNQHVLLGCPPEKLEMTTTDGQKLKPLSLEIVPELDLARILVQSAPEPLKLAPNSAVDDAVATVGNSLDAGVITVNPGTVRGIGAGEIEVDCEVVPGQSGGPLINSAGEVLGATTYILFANEDKTSEGTRYAKKRYFVVRLGADTPWKPVISWPEYAKVGAVVRDAEEVFEEALDIALSADSGPRKQYTYKGLNQKLQDAVRNHNRFVQKMEEMDGAIGTSMQLNRNNASLGSSFRGVYRSIIDACKAEQMDVEKEIRATRAKNYPWLFQRCKDTVLMLSTLQEFLEGRSKARPKFLTW